MTDDHHGFGWPTCAVCGKGVERVTSTEDPFFNRVTFRVECHGETETVEVDMCEIAGAKRTKFGEAFRGPKAPPSGVLRR